ISYLGTKISPQAVYPQPVKFNQQVKTLHDVQRLVGAIQWLRALIGIPNDLMQPLFEMLKGKHPWEK
ncbi:PO113 protein, partial [Nothocercus julius]|nr:PO113 protein [Nothocercus julius]